MRRIAFLAVIALPLAAGCEGAGPTAPVSATQSDISASVQNDSTPADSPSESTSGGIMIGSGT